MGGRGNENRAGLYQREQQVLFRCQRPDCRRRVEVDLKAAVQSGLGAQPIMHLHHLLLCHHWGGCRLQEVSAIYPKGVPLIGYLQHPDVLIAIVCAHCEANILLPPRDVIRRLRAAGRGDGSMGVLELAKAIRGPCRGSGMRRFECKVVWTKAVPPGDEKLPPG